MTTTIFFSIQKKLKKSFWKKKIENVLLKNKSKFFEKKVLDILYDFTCLYQKIIFIFLILYQEFPNVPVWTL